MSKPKMDSAPRGQKIVTERVTGGRGDDDVPDMNKAMPSGMKGGPRDLSRTLGGAKVPGGASD